LKLNIAGFIIHLENIYFVQLKGNWDRLFLLLLMEVVLLSWKICYFV